MKKLLKLLITACMLVTCFTVNVFAEAFSIDENVSLSESGWDQSVHDSIVISEGANLTVDCFAMLNSLTIEDGATVTIVPSDGEPNGFMINEDGSLTLGNSASIISTHDDGNSDGLLDLKGVTVSGLNLWRRSPGNPDGEQITNSPINGMFSYDTGLGKWFLSEEEFGPTDEFPYVIHFHCSEGGSVAITNLTIEDENINVDGQNTTVRLPNTTTSVEFTYTPDSGKIIDGIWIEQDGDEDHRFVDLDDDERHNSSDHTFTLDISSEKYKDPENDDLRFVNMDFSFRDEDGEFGPTNEKPYVISYQYSEGGSISITSPSSIEDEDIFFDETSNIHSIRVENSVDTITFKYELENYSKLAGIWIEQGNETINLDEDDRLDKVNNTFTLDISSGEYNDPEIAGAKFVYVKFDFEKNDSYELHFPDSTSIDDNVVTYRVQKEDDDYKNVTVTIEGAEVDPTNHCVLIPKNNLDSVTFTINYDDFGEKYKSEWEKFARNFDLRISEGNVSLPLTNRQTSFATISSDVDLPDIINLEVLYYKFPWYTISYGNSGNIQTEHGDVYVERIHCGENTFTNIDDEVNEENKIYPMSMLTGGNSDVESPEYDPENDTLAKYKLVYGTGDIFVELGTGDVLIDYKFIPEYGYQVTDIVLNESDSILEDFNPNVSTISEFTFTTEKNSNVHFLVIFGKTDDLSNVDRATNITGASITNGANATKTGNLALTIEDDETDTTIENAISTFDVTLDNVVSMGRENENWTTNITEFAEPIIVNLALDTNAYDGGDYIVVREHDGVKEVLPGTTYNATTGELTFQTNRFSKYTIVEIPKPHHNSDSTKFIIPKTGIK